MSEAAGTRLCLQGMMLFHNTFNDSVLSHIQLNVHPIQSTTEMEQPYLIVILSQGTGLV